MKFKNNLIGLNSLVLILLIGLFVVFSGCDSTTKGNENGFSFGIGNSNSMGGNSQTQGVVIKFDENNPPSEMIKANPYTFVLLVYNYQDHEINDLEIKTKGFEKGFVSGIWDEKTIPTIPKKTNAGPGFTQEVISGVTGDNFNGNYNFNPIFEYAYTAHTTYIEQLCIPDTMNKCDIKVDKSSTQNGPVSVKITRLTSLPDKIRIDFSAINVGNGKVVNAEDKFKRDNYVAKYQLDEVKLGSTQGVCHSIGTDDYQFMNGKSNFYCEFSRSSDGAYASQISVKLTYIYNQEITKKIVIKDLNQGN